MNWQDLSTREHAEKRFEAALLPIGTIEAHDGGPVGTDNLIPDALCDRLSERLGIPKLPLMPYGVTNSLLAYPGSCSLTDQVLEDFLYELGKTLARGGLRYLFVVNGHGGNTDPLRAGARRLFRDSGVFVAVIDWWVETRRDAEEIFGKGGMGHSAIDEMAALLGFCPRFRDSLPGGEVASYYYWQGVRVYPVPRPVIVYENPDERVDFSRLTPEKCSAFAERVTDVMARVIEEILAGWREI
jgi:creatinine amidohydrolase